MGMTVGQGMGFLRPRLDQEQSPDKPQQMRKKPKQNKQTRGVVLVGNIGADLYYWLSVMEDPRECSFPANAASTAAAGGKIGG